MRFRNITFATTLVIVLALMAVFVPRRVQVVPQVRLLRLTPKKVKPPTWLRDIGSAWIGALDSPQESWNAEFEIQNPEGSGILLSDGQIDVELLSASGDWTTAVIPPNRLLLEVLSIMNVESRSLKITSSSERDAMLQVRHSLSAPDTSRALSSGSRQMRFLASLS